MPGEEEKARVRKAIKLWRSIAEVNKDAGERMATGLCALPMSGANENAGASQMEWMQAAEAIVSKRDAGTATAPNSPQLVAWPPAKGNSSSRLRRRRHSVQRTQTGCRS